MKKFEIQVVPQMICDMETLTLTVEANTQAEAAQLVMDNIDDLEWREARGYEYGTVESIEDENGHWILTADGEFSEWVRA